MAAKNPPASGFRLNAVRCLKQAQVPVASDAATGKKRGIVISWDWRVVSKSEFEVKLGVEIEPQRSAPETIAVTLIGLFVRKGKTTLPTERFVGVNAIGILMPYAREALSNLSSRGPYGTYYLPAINVVELSKQFDFSKTTGARQIRPVNDGNGTD